ncbi:MAG: DNA methyltransferase [Chloroflexi bacterium]|nr:DNA methyltransferase [Chloroflexota bacterium]
MDILRELPDECVDPIYLDPPFNSNSNYVAAFGDKGSVAAQLRDIWRWTVESENSHQRLREGKLLNAINAVRLVSGETSPMASYALFMGQRLAEMHRVLKPTGSLYLHCDPNANWLLRVLLDTIFGANNFQNEISWLRSQTRSSISRRFRRAHDTILFYSKTAKYQFDGAYKSLSETSLKLYNREDNRGHYQLVPLLVSGKRNGETGLPWRRIDPNERGKSGMHWVTTPDKLEQYEKEGRIAWPQKNGGAPRLKFYLEENPGVPVNDFWDDVAFMSSQSDENLGYPTQKPLALLERIITASSDESGLVLDPFCGCGTAADAAAKLGRGYLGIDVSAIAVRVMEQRLASRGGKATPVVYKMGWEDYEWEVFEYRALMSRADAEDGTPGHAWAEDKVAGLLNAVPNDQKTGDGGIDARYFTEAGEIVPIQVKMHKGQISRPDMDRLLGVQTSLRNQRKKAPMSLMVTLYPPREQLRVFAAQQGHVTLRGERYPKMQILSVQEMLTAGERPKLPPVDPRYFVGDTQTRLSAL